ncbi:MAG: AAA family ATPase [Candidatus Anstonellales archaeon]
MPIPTFDEILSKERLIINSDVLSPHYLPEKLLHRDKEISFIMKVIAPAIKKQAINNLFIYGKTGTGKTACMRYIMKEFEKYSNNSIMTYVNCKIYNSRYKVMQKSLKEIFPELDKLGFGIQFIYEKLLELLNSGRSIIMVLDEIDMVSDLDDLVYTITRANDESKIGHASIIGISNKLSFKERLDPRTKSSLCEVEMVFYSYNAQQLKDIIKQRVEIGFKPNVVEESAINLAAAITANDNGDARYALTLMLRAGQIAEQKGLSYISDKEIEEARKVVDNEIVGEVVKSLPEHQKLVLLAIAQLTIEKTKQQRLTNYDEDSFLSGEVYEKYCKICKSLNKQFRSARWYREYLHDLEMLGLITITETGKGIRGHSRLIKIGYIPERIIEMITWEMK